jgi:hypothetical protein
MRNEVKEQIKPALHKCHRVAEELGLSEITMNDINKEIEAVRNNN